MKAVKLFGKILLFIIFAFLFVKVLFPYYRVKSHSMEPTIKKDEIIFVSRFHYSFFEPGRNDIVLLKPESLIFTKGLWIHRIISIEGDKVEIKNGIIKVNEKEIIYPRIQNADNLTLEVPKGRVFQKGDNPKTIYGIVDKSLIIGKVVFHF